MQNNPSIESLHEEIQNLKELIVGLNQRIQMREEEIFGEWISEKRVIELTGLSKRSLLRLRQDGKLRESRFVRKGIFYKSSDLKRLLDQNHKLS